MMKVLQSIFHVLQQVAMVLGWLSLAMVLIMIISLILLIRSKWYKREVIDYVDEEMKEEDTRETPKFQYSDFFDN